MWKTWTGGPEAAPLSSPQSGGPSAASGLGGWHPTILWLAGLLALEWLVALWLLAHL